MNNLVEFKFENNAIRTITDENGEVLFVGKDVAKALGYIDTTNAIKQHCRGVVKRHPIVDSLGRTQEVRVLTEPDVLRLIVNCKLPAGEIFEKWVFEEVLPTIRKTGSYQVQKQLPQNEAVSIIEGGMRIAQLFEVPTHYAQIESVKEAKRVTGIDYTAFLTHAPAQNNIPDEDVMLEPTELGKKLGYSAVEMNRILDRLGLQEKQNNEWVATAKGEPLSTRHSWSTRFKSGYNLKWKVTAIEKLLNV